LWGCTRVIPSIVSSITVAPAWAPAASSIAWILLASGENFLSLPHRARPNVPRPSKILGRHVLYATGCPKLGARHALGVRASAATST
jgi:hypothetical protein